MDAVIYRENTERNEERTGKNYFEQFLYLGIFEKTKQKKTETVVRRLEDKAGQGEGGWEMGSRSKIGRAHV